MAGSAGEAPICSHVDPGPSDSHLLSFQGGCLWHRICVQLGSRTSPTMARQSSSAFYRLLGKHYLYWTRGRRSTGSWLTGPLLHLLPWGAAALCYQQGRHWLRWEWTQRRLHTRGLKQPKRALKIMINEKMQQQQQQKKAIMFGYLRKDLLALFAEKAIRQHTVSHEQVEN